jgi:hypothetical protein
MQLIDKVERSPIQFVEIFVERSVPTLVGIYVRSLFRVPQYLHFNLSGISRHVSMNVCLEDLA